MCFCCEGHVHVWGGAMCAHMETVSFTPICHYLYDDLIWVML